MNTASESEYQAYHDQGRKGFFTISFRDNGVWHDRNYRLAVMDEVIAALPHDRDTYISQAEFDRPGRRIVHLRQIQVAFLDLDIYNSAYAVLTPESAAQAVLQHCSDEGVPAPSLVVFSGRGLQVKWLFDNAVPRQALPRWQAIQENLCARFKAFGADPKARDAARVLRLVNTVNSKSSEHVRVLVANRHGIGADSLLMYDFDQFCDEILPVTREQIQQQRAAKKAREAAAASGQPHLSVVGKKRPQRRLDARQLAWDRLDDLRTLARLRGGVQVGQRDIFVFLSVCFLAWAMNPERLRLEVRALVAELCPDWSVEEAKKAVSTAVKRAEASARGEKVVFKEKLVDPRYKYSNGRLIELLDITPNEQRFLRTIIDSGEKKRRQTERRRAAGVQERSDYLETRRENSIEHTQPWVAAGISRATWYRRKGNN